MLINSVNNNTVVTHSFASKYLDVRFLSILDAIVIRKSLGLMSYSNLLANQLYNRILIVIGLVSNLGFFKKKIYHAKIYIHK